jgi:ABC-type xylose transport system substrate-binding protein
MFFNGSGNRAFIAPTDLLGFVAGDWTVECWLYPTLLGDYYLFFDNRGLGNGVGLYVRNGVEVASNTNVIAAGGSLTTNTWAHVAFTRNNGVLRGFINGSSVLSVSDTRTYAAITNATVGGGYDTIQPFNGYISDFRITKGRARYTANFTPPTAKLGFNNAE